MQVVSCFGQLVSGLSLQSASFSHSAVFVGFVVTEYYWDMFFF